MKETYYLYWSPEGGCIAKVQAKSKRAAIRKAPMPYRKYLGEIYALTEAEQKETRENLARAV